ncbi:hypothetical protein LIER_06204 [Lithospermum erythrorhizon]|uniref:DUF4283 domain-containing protein n=1 Tax=Lithospermum erythrorhizon TaxID=34254 RepID=A0AAV3P4B8_LITER
MLSNSLNQTNPVPGQSPHLLVNAVAHGAAPATTQPQNALKVSVHLSSAAAAPTYAVVVNSLTSLNRMKLAFIPPYVVNGRSVGEYKVIDVLPGINRWKSATLGYVMGFRPEFDQMEKFAKSNWEKFGFESMHKLSAGMFLFQFQSDVDRDRMLEDGPWIFARRPLVIKAWTHDAKIDRKGEARVLVWPLMADSATSALERMAYARIYVEIDVNWAFPEFVPLMDDLGNEFQQKISFEWIPPKCSYCNVFGHSDGRCFHSGAPPKKAEDVQVKLRKHRVVQKWKPKSIPVESKVESVVQQIPIEVSQDEIIEDVVVDRIVVDNRRGTSHGSIPVKNTFASLDEEESEIEKVDADPIMRNVVDGSDSSSKTQSSKNGENKKKSQS